MKVKRHPPNKLVCTMLISVCGRGGRYIAVPNYLVEMTEFGMVPISRCFDMVVDGLKNCGKHDFAKKIEQLGSCKMCIAHCSRKLTSWILKHLNMINKQILSGDG
ncbi:hypothetical protein SAY87_027030 [Trapa incisa]|uniref:Uncharacterized protein n=1 Tax=Trapa incisa TaxID=236973 RepID=A0AAN7GR60_9MYRT|nr:hypothetical protein SAY87_027030 [Trapa incisa]